MKKIIGDRVKIGGGIPLPLSKAICADGLIFVSGQLGLNASGQIVEGGIVPQTEQAIENIAAVLAEADLALSSIVKITGWLVNASDFPDFNRSYGNHFADDPPARSMVISGLLIPGALVEIEAIAVREHIK